MEIEVQRLQMGDVILADSPDQGAQVEATVVRDIERTEDAVRVVLRAEGRDDVVKEWALGETVTVVRGP